MTGRLRLKYCKAGLDIGFSEDPYESYRLFQSRILTDLLSVAEDLRHVPPPRTGWGHWRAVAHDFVYEVLEL